MKLEPKRHSEKARHGSGEGARVEMTAEHNIEGATCHREPHATDRIADPGSNRGKLRDSVRQRIALDIPMSRQNDDFPDHVRTRHGADQGLIVASDTSLTAEGIG